MEEPDPIAENQTEVVISTLMARKDGDVVLSHAVAASLAYIKRLGAELAELKQSLWSADDLDRKVKAQHERECRECSVRKWVEEFQKQQKQKQEDRGARKPFWSYVFSERGLIAVLALLFALMCIYQTLGPAGYRAVTGTAREALSKGDNR